MYRLGRGDYYYTISQMTGFGVSTVSTIVQDVSQAIITSVWLQCITHHFPQDGDQVKEKMLHFKAVPILLGAIDECHIPITCPKGGIKSRQEYYNFKNLYSVVLMAIAIVDAKYRFIWWSNGFAAWRLL